MAYFESIIGSSGTPITPSDSSPVSMTSGETYEPTTNGYAIASYTSVTPTTSGAYFSSGMKKMSSSGYAYSSKPSTLAISPGNYVSIGGQTGTMPYSISSAGLIGLMIGTKGYSTLTTTQPTRVWVSGIRSNGSIVNLKSQGSETTVDISAYDYVWYTMHSATNVSLSVSIS